MRINNFGFIGAGNVGTTFGKYLRERGCAVSGYYSRHIEDAEGAARFTDSEAFASMEELAAASDVIFTAVPDGAIADVWRLLRSMNLSGKCVCHFSGALSSRVFDGILSTGAVGLSVHPLAAVNSKWDFHERMHKVSFTIEGDDSEAAADMRSFLRSLGNQAEIIDADQKNTYHAGAVFLTNFVVALVHSGMELLSSCGLDREFVNVAAGQLFFGNAENIHTNGVVQALTGPVDRGDTETVIKHFDCLDEPLSSIYRLLSIELLGIAEMKHPERDYTELEKELKK
ncbi:MAG: DUF2520 domain-containing protein [Clostridiales Family XIII bacterium]|jgi:predicted short-subunit dehydrogenase-like oxidoreductase (DUF2520 family)|nr:DUF2520 domain-containing protein [Clostridiales Family XIII bacterium]